MDDVNYPELVLPFTAPTVSYHFVSFIDYHHQVLLQCGKEKGIPNNGKRKNRSSHTRAHV